MTVRELMIKLGYDLDTNSENKVKSSIKGIKSFAGKALGVIGIGFSIAGISQLAEAAADAEALKSQFTQVFGEMESEARSKLDSIASSTGVNANRIKSSFTQIAAFAKVSGVEQAEALELSDRAMKAVTDSAAFYDRSIENVTESLQSFLKGNFENDAALGLSCTETTRNTAANELYGKSFQALSEAEKQFTLLKMVEDANAASGALGQAARESDTWTNQLGNLKQSLTDLKAAAGAGILKPAVAVLKVLITLTQGLTKAISKATGENGIMTRSFERLHGLIKRIQPSAERMMKSIQQGAGKVINRLGGMENILKMLSLTAGTFLLIMNWSKITAGAQAFKKVLSVISKLFSAATLKALALVAGIVILALIFEDFINFMKGNDSVIGAVLEKAGIDADKVRQTILNAFGKVRDFFVTIWPQLKNTISAVFKAAIAIVKPIIASFLLVIKAVFNAISQFWNAWGSKIISWFSKVWENLGGIISGFLKVIEGIANFISSVFAGDWQGAWEAIKQIFSGVWEAMVNLLSAVWETIKLQFTMVLGAIQALWQTAWNFIKAFFEAIWNGIVSFITSIWSVIKERVSSAVRAVHNIISTVLTAIWNLFSSIFTTIYNFVINTFNNIASGISSLIGNIKNIIVNGFNAAIDFIKSLPAQAAQWGADFIQGLVSGITNSIGKVTSAVTGVANKIKSMLHFSVPDEGPLTDYESWMPDFMSGLAQGISGNEDIVLDRVRSLASGMAGIVNAATADVATASAGVVNKTSSMTQNVNISNSYSGGSMETQKNVSKAMKKSAVDATTYMARGLAYARG